MNERETSSTQKQVVYRVQSISRFPHFCENKVIHTEMKIFISLHHSSTLYKKYVVSYVDYLPAACVKHTIFVDIHMSIDHCTT